MPFVIRVLDAGEEGVLDSVAPNVFDNSIDADAARAFLADPEKHLVVAQDEGMVVGFVSAIHYFHPDKPIPELWIDEVGVAPSHQGRGIGKAMMMEMLEVARRKGCHQAWVLTDRDNTAAMRLYASAGGGEPSEHVMISFRL